MRSPGGLFCESLSLRRGKIYCFEFEFRIHIRYSNSSPRKCGFQREGEMQAVSRRTLLKCAVGAGAIAAGSLLRSPAVLAQPAPIKLKFGNDLPVTHSVNVRLKEA